jgi:hypothetical protein
MAASWSSISQTFMVKIEMYLSRKMKISICVMSIKTIYKQYIIGNWMYTLHVYSFFKNKQITKENKEIVLTINI